MPHEVVVGALIRSARVLLVHRRSDRRASPDRWDLPGGHVEPGEASVDALVRELREELDVTALAVGPPVVRIERDVDRDDGLRLEVRVVTSWAGEPRNAAEEEHDDLRWVLGGELEALALAHEEYAVLLPRLAEAQRRSRRVAFYKR